jgi:hypothetical protein
MAAAAGDFMQQRPDGETSGSARDLVDSGPSDLSESRGQGFWSFLTVFKSDRTFVHFLSDRTFVRFLGAHSTCPASF